MSLAHPVSEHYSTYMSSKDSNDFKKKFPFEKRKDEAARIRAKYPYRIPVIVQKRDGAEIQDIDKNKYLVPNDITVGQFLYVIRKRIRLDPEQAIYIFVNNMLPPTSTLMSVLYQEQKDADGFLYAIYSGESMFGSKSIDYVDKK